MASKGIESIILELVELGYSERKILNRLKSIKDELITEDVTCIEDNKKYNKLINGLIFGGRFYISSPTSPLLGLIKNVKNSQGSEFAYYLLYNILTSENYITNQIHDKSDVEKCNWLMYLIKEKLQKYIIIFNDINKGCIEPI